MDNKKGIRLKTKEVSLVDNIVSFFKKDPKTFTDADLSPQHNQKDASPRSTTPRKKIFNKTPEKAGKINFIKSNIKNGEINNKSMNGPHELTFQDGAQIFHKTQTKSDFSPNNKVNYVSKAVDDTQFNKLISGASILSTNDKKQKIPEKTFLSEHNLNLKPSQNISQFSERQKLNQVTNEVCSKKIREQLEHYKRLSEQLRNENFQLKKQNQKLSIELQNLQMKLKSYELSNRNNNTVEVISLETPKSPFEKQSQINNKNKKIMKQCIPILPQTPNEYNNKKQSPKIEQISYMSSNLKSISNQNSFISQNSDLSAPNFVKNQDQSFQSGGNNHQLLSPFMEKTVYQRTMKPHSKNRKSSKQLQQKEQITFSKTVGYLKGDQPQNQKNSKSQSQNPFQQIATESNKFFFQPNNQSQSLNSFNVLAGNKGFPTRQWLTFNESQSNQQVSNQINIYENSNAFKKQNPFSKVLSPLGKSRDFEKSKDKVQKSQKLLKSNSVSKSQKIDQSRTYKFEDFDVSDQGSSYVDFF